MQMQVTGVDLRDAPEGYSSWRVDAKELEDLGELFCLSCSGWGGFILGREMKISSMLGLWVSGFTRARGNYKRRGEVQA